MDTENNKDGEDKPTPALEPVDLEAITASKSLEEILEMVCTPMQRKDTHLKPRLVRNKSVQ